MGIRRHVGQIVHNHKHLDHRSQGVEQGHLHRSGFRDVIAFLPQIYVALKSGILTVLKDRASMQTYQVRRRNFVVISERVEEYCNRNHQMSRNKGSARSQFRFEPVHGRHRFQSPVQNRLLEASFKKQPENQQNYPDQKSVAFVHLMKAISPQDACELLDSKLALCFYFSETNVVELLPTKEYRKINQKS